MLENKLILGTVQMGLPYGINNDQGQITEEDSIVILRYAFQNGINYLDTAEAYGTAHAVIGKYHQLYPDNKFHVITKLPHHIDQNIAFKVETYLNELNVTSLHALLFHSYTSYKENIENLHLLNTSKENGKIEKLGVSVYTNDQIDDVICDENIDIIQLPYNIFDNKNQRGIYLEKIRQSGKTIHTRSCFLQGLFFSSIDSEKTIVTKLRNELMEIQNISVQHSISVQRIALNYCIQEPLIDQVLIGVDTLDQLKKNISDAQLTISNQIIDEINSTIIIENENLLNPSLWNNL